mgnify:CR=1 FL=1
MDKTSRSTIEMQDKSSRPEMAETLSSCAQYDTVFVGFPIWWYVAPTIIDTFLESYDFSGKKIDPAAADTDLWKKTVREVLRDTDKFPTELSCAEASVSAPQSIAANITAATAVVDMIYNILTVGETRVRQITFATGSVNMRATLQKSRRKAA